MHHMYKTKNPVCRCCTEQEFGLVPSIFFYVDSIYLFVLHFERLVPRNGYLLFVVVVVVFSFELNVCVCIYVRSLCLL